MWEDPIVAEVRQARAAYAKKYDYKLRAIYQALKVQEKREEWEEVSFPPKLIQATVQATGQLLSTTPVVTP